MPFSKRTKIVCTVGPASAGRDTLCKMIKTGMNVARLNFSHGTYVTHSKLLKTVRAAAKLEGQPITILQDLQGPKIRVGDLPKEGVVLSSGETIIFSTKVSLYKKNKPQILPVTYKKLDRDVSVGQRIFLDDGLMEVKIEKVKDKEIITRVITGGLLLSHKGMNFPDSTLRVSALSEKDKKDLAFGLKQKVDWVALSFVTSAKDVLELRRLITKKIKNKNLQPNVLVKIEKHEAIENFDEILAVVDGVMVARGDLGVEIPAEEVPIRQKEIIEKCRKAGKPVIVATQMLDSMIRNPRPTRAEVSDVANAVIDHADAVMLSGESATGKYPLEAVETMSRIIKKTESSSFDDLSADRDTAGNAETIISHALRLMAKQKHINGVLTASFFTPSAERLNLSRPELSLFIAATSETEVRKLNLRWGVKPFLLKKCQEKVFVKNALKVLQAKNLIHRGMKLAVVLGHETGFEILEV
jgi:pyruvate kinase